MTRALRVLDGRRTLVLDLPGCARDDAPSESMGLGPWVESIDALATALPLPRFVLLGHSAGGFLALEYTLRHPERVAGLVLIASAPSTAVTSRDVDRYRERLSPAAWDRFARAVTLALRDDDELRDAWAHALPSMLEGAGAATKAAELVAGTVFRWDAFRRGSESLAGWSVESRLGDVAVPTLVLAGGNDWRFPPERSAEAFRALADAEVHVLDGCGHFPFVDDPTRVVAVLGDWLARRAPVGTETA